MNYIDVIDQICETMPDKISKKIFRETVLKYNLNDNIENNISKLMAMAHNQIQKNSEEIALRIRDEEVKQAREAEEMEAKKKADRLARLRRRARTLLDI